MEVGSIQVVVGFDLVATRTVRGVTRVPKLGGHGPGKARSATMQAATRVKPEQASKDQKWLPTRQSAGEGRCDLVATIGRRIVARAKPDSQVEPPG